jgi:hypothetical protein
VPALFQVARRTRKISRLLDGRRPIFIGQKDLRWGPRERGLRPTPQEKKNLRALALLYRPASGNRFFSRRITLTKLGVCMCTGDEGGNVCDVHRFRALTASFII